MFNGGYFRYIGHKHLVSWKMLAIVVVSALSMDSFLAELRRYCLQEGERLSPWGMPLIWDKQYVSVIFLLIFLFAIADFPLDRSKEKYVISRIGTTPWIWIQQIYLIVFSFLYVMMLLVLQFILLLSVTTWTMEWGRGWERLTNEQMRMKYTMILTVPKERIYNQDIIKTNVCYLLLLFLILVFMAELVLWLNMYHKLVSALLAAMLAIIPLSGKLSGRIFFFIPTTWMQQKVQYSVYQTNQPTLEYMYLCLGLAIVLLILFGMERCSRTQENNRRRY